MITGDNPLTACHVGRELHFTKKHVTLILINTKDKWLWLWKSVDSEVQIDLKDRKKIWEEYALCITGEVRKNAKSV